jgi:adenylate cyclase
VRFLFEDYALDTNRRELARGGAVVHLEPQVYDLLEHLVRHRDRMVSRDDLITCIWNGRIVSESTLASRINAVRAAVGDSGRQQRLIKTAPRKGIRFVGSVRQEQMTAPPVGRELGPEQSRPLRVPSDKPRIAVLLFTDMSDETGQDYFADGITDDIITELSRFSELLVIARNSSFRYRGGSVDVRDVARELGVRYVLEGSVRRSGNRVRIGAQLAEADTRTRLWAERYDRKIDDVFAVQDDVARTVATILVAHIGKTEAGRTLLKPPAKWEAHDYYLRASATYLSFLSSYAVTDLYETRRLLEKSLSVDQGYARPYGLLSNSCAIAYLQPVDGDHGQDSILRRAYELALKGVQLDPNLPFAHAKLGVALAHAGHLEESISAFERAGTLNPNFTDWRLTFPLLHAGQFLRAIEVADNCMRLDPFCTPGLANLCAHAHYMLEDHSAAQRLLRDSVSRLPNSLLGRCLLAATCARSGRAQEATAQAAEVLRILPSYSINGTQKRLSPFKDPEHADRLFDGLRKAGLPEI